MPYPPTSVNIRAICGRLFSARSFCAFRAFCGNIFSPTDFTDLHRCLECAVLQQNTEFGSVGMAGMPYPPTSVLICVICGRFFSARSFRVFRAFCGNLFPPTDFTDLHRCLGCALFPRNPQNPQNLAAWVCSRDTIPSYICEHPCRLWEALLCQRFCEFRAHLWEALLSQKFLCVPCVLWEYLFSHGIHRIHRICQRGYCRDAIPS